MTYTFFLLLRVFRVSLTSSHQHQSARLASLKNLQSEMSAAVVAGGVRLSTAHVCMFPTGLVSERDFTTGDISVTIGIRPERLGRILFATLLASFYLFWRHSSVKISVAQQKGGFTTICAKAFHVLCPREAPNTKVVFCEGFDIFGVPI